MMRIINNLIALPALLLMLLVPGFVHAKSSDMFDNLTLPEMKSFVNSRGLRTFYMKDEMPRTTIVLSIGMGSIYENSENAGLSDFIARSISIAGSKKYPGNKFHQTIETIGGRFSISSSWERTLISIQVLERHTGIAMELLDDLVRNPNFETGSVENARSIILEGIRRKLDRPFALAFERLRNIIFKGRGYGAVSTKGSIKGINIQAMKDSWEKHLNSGNMALAVSSSRSFEVVSKMIRQRTGKWSRGKRIDYTINADELKKGLKKSSAKIYFIPRDIPQATIVLGTIAPNIRFQGKYDLSMMNYILGGGSFNSRLMMEIRVKRGLTYSTGSILRFRKSTGIFLAYAQTRTVNTTKALSLLVKNINKMAVEKVSSKELDWAKSATINSYIFEFQTPLQILKKYLYLNYAGMSGAYLKEYPGRIGRVAPEKARMFSHRMLKGGLVKVVVGNPALKKELKKIGPVVVLTPELD